MYVFLDEVQHVPQFEKVVGSLFIKPNVDIYITGSNAYFMSSDIATLLTGEICTNRDVTSFLSKNFTVHIVSKIYQIWKYIIYILNIVHFQD